MEKTAVSATATVTGFIMLKRKDATIQDRAEKIFSVRSKPLIRGGLREKTQKAADAILGILTENITIKGKEEKEFRKLAVSFSRLIASYCSDSETGKPIIGISPNMGNVLLCFSEMLQEETKLAVEERLPSPFFSLSKFSVYEIADVKYKLKEHPDLIVRKNAGNILHAAIIISDLSLAEKLAKEAKPTRDRLAEEFANDEVVIRNLNTIMNAALHRGDLSLAEKLAKEAKPTRDRLSEEFAGNELVIKNLDTIMYAALHRGDLNLAEKLAKEAKPTRDRLAEEFAGNEVVIGNLGAILQAALFRRDLSLAEKLAKEISMSGSLAALRR